MADQQPRSYRANLEPLADSLRGEDRHLEAEIIENSRGILVSGRES